MPPSFPRIEAGVVSLDAYSPSDSSIEETHMHPRRSMSVVAIGVALLASQPTSRSAGAVWQPRGAPTAQSQAPLVSGQSAAGTVTTYVPQYQVVYETVYDT